MIFFFFFFSPHLPLSLPFPPSFSFLVISCPEKIKQQFPNLSSSPQSCLMTDEKIRPRAHRRDPRRRPIIISNSKYPLQPHRWAGMSPRKGETGTPLVSTWRTKPHRFPSPSATVTMSLTSYATSISLGRLRFTCTAACFLASLTRQHLARALSGRPGGASTHWLDGCEPRMRSMVGRQRQTLSETELFGFTYVKWRSVKLRLGVSLTRRRRRKGTIINSRQLALTSQRFWSSHLSDSPLRLASFGD